MFTEADKFLLWGIVILTVFDAVLFTLLVFVFRELGSISDRVEELEMEQGR